MSTNQLSPDLTPTNHNGDTCQIKMVPNGGIAVLDEDGKMLAYKKRWRYIFPPDEKNVRNLAFDWVRKDFRG